jgi:hypothetical protein
MEKSQSRHVIVPRSVFYYQWFNNGYNGITHLRYEKYSKTGPIITLASFRFDQEREALTTET